VRTVCFVSTGGVRTSAAWFARCSRALGDGMAMVVPLARNARKPTERGMSTRTAMGVDDGGAVVGGAIIGGGHVIGCVFVGDDFSIFATAVGAVVYRFVRDGGIAFASSTFIGSALAGSAIVFVSSRAFFGGAFVDGGIVGRPVMPDVDGS